MELHKPDFMQGEDKGKQGRDQKKKKKEGSNSFCCDLCSEAEVSLRVSGLFCSTSPSIIYFSAGYFIRHLPKIKHFLNSDLSPQHYNICSG